jgi:hypothetical protein
VLRKSNFLQARLKSFSQNSGGPAFSIGLT